MTDDKPMALCADCHKRLPLPRSLDDYVDWVEHYINTHPESDRFANIVDDIAVKTTCEDCGETFAGDMSRGFDKGEIMLSVPSYCRNCREEGYRAVVVTMVSARQVVHNEAKEELLDG